MAALTEGNYPGDFLIEEFGAPNHCREEVTIKVGEDLAAGTVLAVDVGGDGSYVAFEDDTDTPAAGILLVAVDASAAAKKAVAIVRGPCVVSKAGLTWHANNDATDITNGLADLLAVGIVAREGV
jgi:hypothetical protein